MRLLHVDSSREQLENALKIRKTSFVRTCAKFAIFIPLEQHFSPKNTLLPSSSLHSSYSRSKRMHIVTCSVQCKTSHICERSVSKWYELSQTTFSVFLANSPEIECYAPELPSRRSGKFDYASGIFVNEGKPAEYYCGHIIIPRRCTR